MAIAALGVGIVVGLTGMGGGAQQYGAASSTSFSYVLLTFPRAHRPVPDEVSRYVIERLPQGS